MNQSSSEEEDMDYVQVSDDSVNDDFDYVSEDTDSSQEFDTLSPNLYFPAFSMTKSWSMPCLSSKSQNKPKFHSPDHELDAFHIENTFLDSNPSLFEISSPHQMQKKVQ